MMNNDQLNAKVTQISLLESQIKELKALVDATKSDIKAELDERQVDMIDTGINRIFYEVYERTTVDTKALRSAGLYDKYSKKSTSLMFKITSVTND
jgi:hypothetical protein